MNCDNLPVFLTDRWKELYSEKELQTLYKALSEKPLPSFRANTLKNKYRGIN